MRFRIFTEPQEGATYDDQLAVARPRGGARLRRLLPLRPLHQLLPRRRPPRPHRRVDHARRPRPRHHPAAARHARVAGDLPPARAAGDRGRPGRRHERRPGRARARCGMERPRARGLRHPVPAHRRALRPARGAARDHHRALGHPRGRAVLVRRHPLLARRLPRAPEAGAAAGPADRDGRVRHDAHAAPGRRATRRVQRRLRAAGAVPRARRPRRAPRARRSAATRRRCPPASPTPSCAAPTKPRSTRRAAAIGRDVATARARRTSPERRPR